MTTWILVANASEARLLATQQSRNTAFSAFKTAKLFFHPESREKAADLVSDSSGRRSVTGNPGHGSYEDASPKEVEAHRFAHELADEIKKGHDAHAFSELVVVAPPHFYGILKQCLKEDKKMKVDVIQKDYTKCTNKELSHYIQRHLWH